MGLGTATARVADMVREMIPRLRYSLSENERELAVHLRGNPALLEALSKILKERIEIREKLPIPNDPVACKVSMARDNELRCIISKLRYIYNSPIASPTGDGEQPD